VTHPLDVGALKSISVAAPHHGDRSREAAAHVEREKFSHVFNLARARLFGELLISLEYLAYSGRADRMTVGD
jgi:hypothetical protein